MKLKTLLLFVTALFSLLSLPAQKKTSELQDQNLQGKVRTLEETEYNAEEVNGKAVIDQEAGPSSHHLTEFTRRGNIAEEKSFDSENRLISKNRNKYNEVGDLYESNEYNEKGKLCGRTTYTYNSYRQYAVQTIFLSDGSMETGNYCYGNDKLLDSVVWQCGELFRKETFHYNAQGLADEKQVYEGTELKSRTCCRYDAQGRLTEEFREEPADGKKNRTMYTYDENGRIRSVTRKDANERQESRTCWEYDTYGNILVETWYNEDDRQTVRSTCEYTYDAQGNWTQQIWYDDGRAFTITQRTITYY